MNKKAMESELPDRDARSANDGSPHPFDDWLRRELDSLYSGEDEQPLPPDIADLAEKLGEVLASAHCKKKPPASD